MVRKPEGIDRTERLLGVLVQVPKKELDARLAKRKAKKRAKQRKVPPMQRFTRCVF